MKKLYLFLSFTLFSFSILAQAPADEDFSDDAPTNNQAQTFTNDGVIYFQDGVLANGQYIEIFESTAYNLNFPPGSNALVYNVGQAFGGTQYGFRSENGAEFRLASMVIDVAGAPGGFATQYIIRGYRNGVEEASATVDFETTGTYGSISYTRNMTYYTGGTLTFSSTAEWKNIDEIRFYWNNNSGMIGVIKSIDFEAAITGTVPVLLTDYKARVQPNGSVKVQWSTTSETNNSHFVVERAGNNGVFSVVGRVEGNGTKSIPTDYAFTDASPLAGTSYYRLVQYDRDGRYKTYATLEVRTATSGAISIYPNPVVNNGFTFKIDQPLTSPVRYTLSSLSGKAILTGTITGQQQYIPLATPLPKGTYLLTLSNGATIKVLNH
ncbi:MAG: T9SS type A sorting domain-containing protein [Flavisolibacter sp.]|nr:T9SS type A sorting domain-containing protein [Flavisolibacter sp.]